VQATAGAFRTVTTGPVQAPAEAKSVKFRLMLRPASGDPAAAYFDVAQLDPTQPLPGEIVRVAGRGSSSAEDASLAEVAGTEGLAPGRATPATLANVKPAQPGAEAPAASTGHGRAGWPILLVIGIAFTAIALTAGHGLRQRKRARRTGADDT
jgi:hypothetical protein